MGKVFEKLNGGATVEKDMELVCEEVLNVPPSLASVLTEKIKLSHPTAFHTEGGKTRVTRAGLSQWLKDWNASVGPRNDPKRRVFDLLAKPASEGGSGAAACLTKEFLTAEDFKPLFRYLLETHPGLEFLAATPEFQERYADTVALRIFFALDANDDGKISWRDFKNSDFLTVLRQVADEEDINKVRDYFSYEHFYVLYCRFWELDTDHDFLIDKEDFSRYEGHALSRKAVDRIFAEVPRKFKSDAAGKMAYEDFVYFMLCEEDKNSSQALRYWFRIIDLDDNDIITPAEMDYFYEE